MVARGVWADEKPYIHLHKARKGRAALKVSLPDGRAFISGMQQQIRRIGQEINIIHYDEVRKATGPYWYTISESNLDIRRPIPNRLARSTSRRPWHASWSALDTLQEE